MGVRAETGCTVAAGRGVGNADAICVGGARTIGAATEGCVANTTGFAVAT